MARYINADALIEAIKHELWDWKTLDGITSTTVLKQTITDIQNTPTADVVEVVRCKDCKHSIEDKLFGGLWCQHPTEKHCERNADFYCGSGERREE